MDELLKTAVVNAINRHRAQTLPEWNRPVHVKYEDTAKPLFDVRDPKTGAEIIVCVAGQGHATYVNRPENVPYELRIISNEEFFNSFNIQGEGDWAKGLARPDLLVYDLGEEKSYFIVHELSAGNIRSKRQDAKMQFLRFLQFVNTIDEVKDYIGKFRTHQCIISATGTPELPTSPGGIAAGFMEIYTHLPDPLPLPHQGIERLGFRAFQTKVVHLT